MHAKIDRWGDNLVICVPNDLLQAVGLHDGEVVDASAEGGAIVVRPLEPELTLDDLLKGKTDDEWRAIYASDRFDWGPDVGREIIPE